nr:immunoglobulin light chain junction region [Macaca mulatta]MPN65943.1 immunoglobulin light chain junction region [Macaca mulatta]MPN66063.1 immunoglobulin light chain junction region [Macaca mulatta]MPN66337.1 immunoglobulin light chain junction region [Macaca mulatta]MPN66596.1 immunoglobulin light chain junction region [Macaca mulatta]
CAIWHSSAYIF